MIHFPANRGERMGSLSHISFMFARPDCLCSRSLLTVFCKALMVFIIVAIALPAAAHQSLAVRRGLSALEKGDLETAATELHKARFKEPGNPAIEYNLGIVEYRRRDYNRAAAHFQNAAAGPDDSMRFDSLYNLGNSAFKAGDYASAIAAYNSSLEIKKDGKAEYNLKIAEEKLKKQLEKQQQQQEQQQQHQDQQKQDNQQKQGDKKDQQEQQKDQNSDQQNQQGDKSQQQADKSQSDQKQNQENGESGEQGDNNEENDQQKADSDNQNQQKDGENEGEQNQQQAGSENETASQTQELTEQPENAKEQQRQDVQMAEPQKESGPEKPEASQRARAMKNIKVNPYMVEKILKDMEQREREYQLHARNERRNDELDPFEMDAEQLRQWMQNRGRPQQQKTDEPDW